MGPACLPAVMVLAACASPGKTTTRNEVRAAVETAPADLQLACAAEAATRLNADPDTVLPVSSAATEPGNFRVDLKVGDGAAECIIDSEANVLSLERV